MVTLVVSPIFLGAILRGCALQYLFLMNHVISSGEIITFIYTSERVVAQFPRPALVAAPRLCRGHECCDKEHPVVPAVIGQFPSTEDRHTASCT